MTEEERWKHIEILSDLRAKYSCFDDSEEPYYKALSAGIKAIKTLEQEPCVTMRDLSEEELKHFAEEMKKVRPQVIEQEPCEEAISRQAVLDGIDTYINKAQSTGTQDDFYSFAELVVKDLPPVTLHPKAGHWIANAPQYDMLNPQYICSECGNAHTRITPYCEMCGAQMVEPQESEDKE